MSPALAMTIFMSFCEAQDIGKIEVAGWYGNKSVSVSITLMMVREPIQASVANTYRLNLQDTFFIITGKNPRSQYQGKFIGRPVKEIVAETATVPTNKDNFY